MGTILDEIVAVKRREVAEAKQARPASELRRALRDAPPVRDFAAALVANPKIALIAEIKKASPSQGVIRADFDPAAIARIYESRGASCLSVLTDPTFFQGELDYLRTIRQQTSLPLLRKDFIIDAHQVLEARLAGADAVLLIAECLDDCQLRSLHNETLELGMTPLVEFYVPANLPRVIAAGATVVGVNNRDLRTFAVDLEHVIRLRGEIPAETIVVAESGIRGRADAMRLEAAGIDAMLVGEHLMASRDIGLAVDALLGVDPVPPIAS